MAGLSLIPRPSSRGMGMRLGQTPSSQQKGSQSEYYNRNRTFVHSYFIDTQKQYSAVRFTSLGEIKNIFLCNIGNRQVFKQKTRNCWL